MTQLDDVKSRLDIVELVGGYVQLQRSGNSFKANCPFHQERTPSFYVFPDRQSWRCFGACAEGGDAFSFYMKRERVDFREALVRLGALVGITITDQAETGGRSRLLFEINDAARKFYQSTLLEPEAGFVRDYLRDRGINDRSLQTFEFGYSPVRDNRLLAHLTNAGYTAETIAEAGLARETEDGRFYDLFRGRLMIPIRDWSARVAGFGSRALDDNATPKYLNTPRTPVFDKSRILYAMHLAKEPVRQHGAVIVEGYMDAVMAHQHGFDNVVASMGTALTEHQVALVRRLTHRVTMALDGDPAGRNATLRSLESSWDVIQQRNQRELQRTSASLLMQPEPVEIWIAELPSGKDPDDYIREAPNEWPGFIAKAIQLFDYLLHTLSERSDSPIEKDDMVGKLLRFVALMPGDIQRSIFVDQISSHLSINRYTVEARLDGVQRQLAAERQSRRVANVANEATPLSSSDRNRTEEMVLAILLQYGDQLEEHAADSVRVDWFSRPENREIFRSVCFVMDVDSNGEEAVLGELEPHFNQLRDTDLMLSTLAKVEQAWQQACLHLEKEHLNKEIHQSADAMEDEDIFGSDSEILTNWLINTQRRREIDLQLQPASPHHNSGRGL